MTYAPSPSPTGDGHRGAEHYSGSICDWRPTFDWNDQWHKGFKAHAGDPLTIDCNGTYTVGHYDCLGQIAVRTLIHFNNNETPTPQQIAEMERQYIDINKDKYPSLLCNKDYLGDGWQLRVPGAEANGDCHQPPKPVSEACPPPPPIVPSHSDGMVIHNRGTIVYGGPPEAMPYQPVVPYTPAPLAPPAPSFIAPPISLNIFGNGQRPFFPPPPGYYPPRPYPYQGYGPAAVYGYGNGFGDNQLTPWQIAWLRRQQWQAQHGSGIPYPGF
jgi:hypothetical protein